MKLWTGFGSATACALAIGLVSAYGLAQPKPGAPAKPAPQAGPAGHDHHAHDCGACDKASCTECDCGACAKSGAGMASDAGTCGGHGKHADMHCPMTQLAGLADVKVENTKAGAMLQLTAKDPSKAGEVQALASKLAEHLKAGGCPMEKPGHDMQGHHHGAPSATPGKAPAAGAPAAGAPAAPRK